MKVRPFIRQGNGASTLDQMAWLVEEVAPTSALFCFAYATVSGWAEFNRRLGTSFWDSVTSQWLVGIDYGRTEPSALERIDEHSSTTIAIHDGSYVLGTKGFFPRRDFHLKSCFFSNSENGRWGMLAGSGNFSRNGLSSSVEGGVALSTRNRDEYDRFLKGVFAQAEALWKAGEPVASVLPLYAERFAPPKPPPPPPVTNPTVPSDFGRFWINVGYVTPNRGKHKPGNQIDMPRGVHEFFGFASADDPIKNSIIGIIHFDVGSGIKRALRFGNNSMEKITLPIPEDYGFGAYDGKIIEFIRAGDKFMVEAYEVDEFERLVHGSTGSTYEMGSGQLYGYRD